MSHAYIELLFPVVLRFGRCLRQDFILISDAVYIRTSFSLTSLKPKPF